MPLWGKTSADADKPKYLSTAEKAETILTESGWEFTQPNGTKEILVSLGDAIPGPVNTAAPAITGTAQAGQVLTTTNGTWEGSPPPTFARLWETAEAAEGPWTSTGVTTTTYTPAGGEVGDYLRTRVTATRNGYDTVVYSNVVGPVIAA